LKAAIAVFLALSAGVGVLLAAITLGVVIAALILIVVAAAVSWSLVTGILRRPDGNTKRTS